MRKAVPNPELCLFIEQAPVAVAMFDKEMRYIAVSQRWLAERGLDSSILGRTAYDVHPDVDEKFRSLHRRALAGEIITQPETRYEVAHSPVEWVSSEMRPWRDSRGKIGGIVIFAEDITARKRADEALKRSEEKLRQQHDELEALYQNAPIGLCFLDRDFRYRRINDRLAEINGLPANSHIGRTVEEVVPTLADEVKRITDEIIATGRTISDMEFVGETQSSPGVTRCWNESWYPVLDESDVLIGFGVVVEEVTEQRKTERGLRDATDRLNLAQSAAEIGIWDWNIQTNEAFVNSECYDIFGLPTGVRASYQEFLRHLHSEDRPRYEELMEAAFSSDGVIDAECRIIRADDGSTRWLRSKGKIIFDEDKRPVRGMGAMWDITSFKELQDAQLQRVEDRYRRIVETAQEGVWLLDVNAKTSFVNPKMAHLLGYETKDMLGCDLRDFMDDEWKSVAEKKLLDRAAGVVETHDFKFRRKDGSELWALLSCAPIFDGSAYLGSLAMVMDFTDRKRLEADRQRHLEEMKLSEKRKDEFLVTLGHELRTPLATIKLALDLVADDKATAEKFGALLTRIQRQVRHLTRMVEDVLQVSRMTRGTIELRKEKVDLNDLIAQIEDAHRAIFEEKGIRLIVNLAKQPLPISGDSTRLTQVFGDILENAAKFTDTGGTVNVIVSRQLDAAVVSVRDTGIGIPREQITWIFELFNQLRNGPERAKEGIGVGLALARKIVELHGGSIEARSEGPGKGSEFIVRLSLS